MTGEATPWLAGEAPGEADKRFAPATLRNRDAIAQVLRGALSETGLVLEVASGSGEHAVHFAGAFPALRWQPSDPDPAALRSIAAWTAEAELANIAPPLLLDASAADWPIAQADAVLCINMTHISPWEATVGLFMGAARLLEAGAPLILYGPYLREGVPTAPSNLAFDQSLRSRDASWGIRSLEAVTDLADAHGFTLEAVHEMPANNLTIVYRRN